MPNCPFKNCTYICKGKQQNKSAVKLHCGTVHGLFEKYMQEKTRQDNIISEITDNLDDQTMANSADVPTVCPTCFICFENQKFLDKHVKAFHENSEENNCGSIAKDQDTTTPTTNCPICKIEFEDKTELNEHMDNKHGDSHKFKFYHCGGSCQKMFYSKIHLNAHKNVAHFQTKPTISKDMIEELQALLKCENPNCEKGKFDFTNFFSHSSTAVQKS